MRLWTLHPKYLDPQGLVALWRESLLARAVLRGETRGYQNHPQLDRFKSHADPRSAVDAYLAAVFDEAMSRGYSFDQSKLGPARAVKQIPAKMGQVQFEWRHLLHKLSSRSPLLFEKWHHIAEPEPHHLFHIIPGEIESWERGQNNAAS